MRLRLALLFALLASPALAQPADIVLRGGNIITVDKDWRIAQAVAISDGRFVAIGDDEAMIAHIGPNTQVIELAGKTVVPGLIDTHLHQLFAALNGPAVQLLGAKSVADVQKAIAERVARTEAGKWVTASIGLAREHPGRRPDADAARARSGVAEQSGVHPARRPRRHGELEGAGACRHHEGHAEPRGRHHRARREGRSDRHAVAERRQSGAPQSCRRRPPTCRSC